MPSWTEQVCSRSLMNIGDKSSNSKLAPVGMAAALISPTGKAAITLPGQVCAQGYCHVMSSVKESLFLSFSCSDT